MNIEFHADDYGLYLQQSRRILDCAEHGCLNGVSVMTNGSEMPACMDMLQEAAKQGKITYPALTVHLNFYEGKALSEHKKVSLLTNDENIFDISFSKLVIASCLPWMYTKYKLQLKEEIRAQIFALRPYVKCFTSDNWTGSSEKAAEAEEMSADGGKEKIGGEGLRLDGHGHYHMIPVVCDAMAEVIRENNLNVTFIRVPREEIGMYFRIRKNLVGFRPINLVKVLILNTFARHDRKKHRELFEKTAAHVFSGVMFSANMRPENARAILPELKKLAEQKQCDVEMLFHPGGVEEEEDIRKITNENDRIFLTDIGRQLEFQSLHELEA